MKKEKVATAGISLSEAYALSEQHPLSEALSSLSELGESRRESVKHAPAQHAINAPSESFVSSGAKRVQLAKRKSTNSCLAGK